MVNLFGSSRKRQSHQGFRKYNAEISDYQRNVAGVPNNGITRNDSMTSSAGSAAVAALRLHQNSSPVPENPATRTYSLRSNSAKAAGRTNSMTSSFSSPQNRSNSLRTYSYHPKGSYTPGQASVPNARRFSSLNSGSQAPQFSSPVKPRQPPAKRLSSLNSNASVPKHTVYEENEGHVDDMDDGDTVITTSTTKVVDREGRVLSITTKTTKQLPDGSNIIETTTKNISRGGSRANSLRNNSILSSSRDPNYNLQKIDEDLQGFEYNYELDSQKESINIPKHEPVNYHERRDSKQLENDLLYNSSSLKLNTDPQTSRTNSVSSIKKSNDSSPIKPLKSILKNSQRPEYEPEPIAEPVEESFDTSHIKHIESEIPHDEIQHPYKTIGTPLTNTPDLKVPEMPTKRKNSSTNTSPKTRQSPTMISPNSVQMSRKHVDSPTNGSVTSPMSSIKFDDNVETIPIYKDPGESSKEKISNQELYNKAFEIAMQKVYGNTTGEVDTKLGETGGVDVPVTAVEKKNKIDKKLETLGHSGVNENYKYENHHKDFATHSFRERGDNDLKGTSRSERAKEEKRQQKELEKQLKAEEKQRKLEAKEQAKLAAKEAKKASPKRRIFGRRKKDNSDMSTLGSSRFSEEEKSLTSVSPISNRMTHELRSGSRLSGSPTRSSIKDSPTKNSPIPPASPQFSKLQETHQPKPKEIQKVQETPLTPTLQSSAVPDTSVKGTPQIEPTISLESESKEDATPEVKVKVPEPDRPATNPSNLVRKLSNVGLKSPATTGISDKDEILTSKAVDVSPILASFTENRNITLPALDTDLKPKELVSVPESPQTPERLRPFIPELARSNPSSAHIPKPMLNDVIEDADEDGITSEYEDVDDGAGNLSSPTSKRSEAYEQFYEAVSGDFQDPVADNESDIVTISGKDGDEIGKDTVINEITILPSQPSELYGGYKVLDEATETNDNSSAKSLKDVRPSINDDKFDGQVPNDINKEAPTLIANDVNESESPMKQGLNLPITSDPHQHSKPKHGPKEPIDVGKNYTLAELIKMGKEDTTEDSFVSPDAAYESDSDVSSRFSADLNAALRRITDDKEVPANSSIFAGPDKVDTEETLPTEILPSEEAIPQDTVLSDEPSSKSVIPTDSEDASPQPSRSTMATKDVRPPEIAIDHKTTKKEVRANKPKKKSKFKEKIFKYFVNTYDK